MKCRHVRIFGRRPFLLELEQKLNPKTVEGTNRMPNDYGLTDQLKLKISCLGHNNDYFFNIFSTFGGIGAL